MASRPEPQEAQHPRTRKRRGSMTGCGNNRRPRSATTRDRFRQVSSTTRLTCVKPARPRCLRCCPGVTVTTLGRPPHRAREGHGQHLQIHSLVSDPDDRHVDHLGLHAALRAVEPPDGDRPRERPNGFQERRWFTTRHRCYLPRRHSGMACEARSSRVYPVSGLSVLMYATHLTSYLIRS